MAILNHIDDDCTRCGICEEQQQREGMPVIQVGDLAEELLAARSIEEVSPEAYEFLVSCALCDACTVACPESISCAEAVKAGRSKLMNFTPALIEDYRAYRVDFKENVFTALRQTAGHVYEDVLDEPTRNEKGLSIFFPGCSLSIYAYDLTQAVYECLLQHEVVQAMSVYCCGKVLGDMGAAAAHQNYGDGLLALLRKKGIKHLVVACPNCYYELKALLLTREARDITLEVLPQTLERLGLTAKTQAYESVAVHTSCPDRFDQSFLQATNRLLVAENKDDASVELKTMANHGSATICCGAGGMARMNAPTMAAERRVQRIKQFSDTQAQCLVCSCMSCVNTFLGGFDAPHTKHILELVFDIAIDWQQAHVVYDQMLIEHKDMFSLPPEQSTRVFDDEI